MFGGQSMRVMVGALLGGAMLIDSMAMAAETPKGAPAQAAETPSPFIQCDGRKGHVGAGELLGQLLAISVTAGLASDAFTKDDGNVEKRLSGRAGADACNLAMAQETNEERRTQLLLARTIHLIEAEDLPAALESVRELPKLAPVGVQDWAFNAGLGSTAAYLESVILVRLDRPAEAEAAALRSAAFARYDLVSQYRVPAHVQLTPTISAEKKAYLDQLVRMCPQHLSLRAELHAWVGDYAAAAKDEGDRLKLVQGFAPKAKSMFNDALVALYQMMAGDKDAGATAARARQGLDAYIAEGGDRSDPAGVSNVEAMLAFFEVGQLAAQGRMAEARTAFAGRTRWVAVPPPVVADIFGKLQANMPTAERTGLWARTRQDYRDDAMRSNLKLLQNPDLVKNYYAKVANSARQSDYARASGSVWKIGAKPRYLARDLPKDVTTYEFINVGPNLWGLSAGEAVLLHAALIASARGFDGFVVPQNRTHIFSSPVRFGNIGTPGFPESATFRAQQVIDELSPRIPEPPMRR